jgi:DNA-binding XRE family transcriptional regulator
MHGRGSDDDAIDRVAPGRVRLRAWHRASDAVVTYLMNQELLPRKAFYRALGKLLKERREYLGLTQAKIATVVGADAPTVCQAEHAYAGPRSYGEPATRLVCRMANALGFASPGALLREAAAIAAQSGSGP